MNIERPSRQTLINYFRGLSPENEEEIIDHYLSMEIDQEYVESCLQEAWFNLNNDVDLLSPDQHSRAWEEFRLRQQGLYQHIRKKQSHWYSYAACITLLILSVAAIIWFRSLNSQEAPLLYTSAPGKLQEVHLKDSSTVLLFPGSSLWVSPEFNDVNRTVTLSGRAFFKVAHNKQKPFEVNTGLLTTKVLGTSFEIEADKSANEHKITLHTGKIRIRSSGKNLIDLIPDQRMIYQVKSHTFQVVSIDAKNSLAWINGELSYELTPLSTICQDLEKWYNVKIKITKAELIHKKISTSFKDLPLQEVLDILSLTTGMSYTITGNQVIIH